MSKTLRVVMAQLNLTVGDISGNLTKLIQSAKQARRELKGDVIVFPELCLTGYPPEDLLFRKNFLEEINEALNQFKNEVQDIYCVVSHPHQTPTGLFNSSSLIYNGKILGRYAKQNLPNYGVFDELRYFKPGNTPCVIPINNTGLPLGIIICEDIWTTTPIQQAATHGARLIVIPNASPFEIDKHEQRHSILAKRAKTENIPIVYVNCVGQQDEIAFDGGSMVVDPTGTITSFAGFCNEGLFPVDFEFSSVESKCITVPFNLPSEEERIYQILVQGVRDYIHKNNFPGALVGVSGGIDSALTLAIAVDALGSDKVEAVLLPSRYTADISNEDALTLIHNLNVQYKTIPIENAFTSFTESLKECGNGPTGVTLENLQSRCRGTLLMALSNQSGKMLLTTGNRSEMAVGYATLYGDMCGGFAVLKDIPKTLVYKLASYRNSLNAVIPSRTIERPPTAELAPNQKDEDTLPPYDVLDKILELYLNQENSVKEIIELGFDENLVQQIVKMINRSEYKRRQSAIGIRINHKAFSKDRRYPITNKFDD